MKTESVTPVNTYALGIVLVITVGSDSRVSSDASVIPVPGNRQWLTAGSNKSPIISPFTKGTVSGSGTGPLDSESRDQVPDLETQSLEVRYRIPRQPYEDCLGVR